MHSKTTESAHTTHGRGWKEERIDIIPLQLPKTEQNQQPADCGHPLRRSTNTSKKRINSRTKLHSEVRENESSAWALRHLIYYQTRSFAYRIPRAILTRWPLTTLSCWHASSIKKKVLERNKLKEHFSYQTKQHRRCTKNHLSKEKNVSKLELVLA